MLALAASLLISSDALVVGVPAPRVAVARTGPPTMNFFDDMQANMQSTFNKMFAQPPTLDEAELYCRDEESTGCTIEMMELIEKQKAKSAPEPKPRWSAEIDDAVVKPE